MPADWSPATYLKFEDERTRPARDLLAQVRHANPQHVVDVGCGPGNSTELLVARFPAARITGFDTSPAMLMDAKLRVPTASFEVADASAWRAGADVVFANAVYQWVPDHLAVLVDLLQAMPAGGELAVQMPDNRAEPNHVLMKQVAARFGERLAGAPRDFLPSAADYYAALKPHARSVEIWHTIYNHVLPSAEAIVQWVKATGLRPFMAPLSDAEQEDFLAEYTQLIAEAYPATAGGSRLFRFPRLFFVATR